MRQPKIESRYVGEELALFWINPWSGVEEKIATFWWPGHPVEETAQVEEWFEGIARRAALGSGPPVSDEALKSRLGPTVSEQLMAMDPDQLVSLDSNPIPGDTRDRCHHGNLLGTWCYSGGNSCQKERK